MATFTGTAQRARSKRVATQDGRGWTSIPDGTDHGDIELEIDVAALLRYLGEKALSNRTGRAGMGHGMIVARARNVRRVR